jgi:hypothetical protein
MIYGSKGKLSKKAPKTENATKYPVRQRKIRRR